MQLIQVLDRFFLESEGDGSQAEAFTTFRFDALAAKSLTLYIMVHEISDNSRLAIAWRHSPNGIQWASGPSDLFDSGAGSPILEAMHVSETEDVTGVALIHLIPKIQSQSGAAIRKATISVWAVLKPF